VNILGELREYLGQKIVEVTVTKTWDLCIAESKYKKIYLSKINLTQNENGYLLVLA
jgi:hypothetical protein